MAAEAHGANANANAGAVAGAGDVGASLRRPFSGQLSKFTNVMKGWQYRWFVLDPEQGRIMYYLPKSGEAAADRSSSGAPASASGPGPGKHRGSQHLAGTVVLPSDEDSQTFHLNFASGESFKLRAANVKERQVWVDRIRAVVQMHDAALAHLNPPPLGHAAASLLRGADHHGARPPTPPGSRSHISNGEPSQQLQHLSLSVLDAFGSVHDIIHQTSLKNEDLCRAVESLPSPAQVSKSSPKQDGSKEGPQCLDEDLLILKATSHAALLSLEQALTVLQDYREGNQGPLATTPGNQPTTSHHHISKSVFALPSSPKKSFSGSSSSSKKTSLSNLKGGGSVKSQGGGGGGQPQQPSSPLPSVSSSTLSLPADALRTPTSTSSATASAAGAGSSGNVSSSSAGQGGGVGS